MRFTGHVFHGLVLQGGKPNSFEISHKMSHIDCSFVFNMSDMILWNVSKLRVFCLIASLMLQCRQLMVCQCRFFQGLDSPPLPALPHRQLSEQMSSSSTPSSDVA